eukprot:scaffold13933_cov219-Amphora_coffeaeformis.AAC.11
MKTTTTRASRQQPAHCIEYHNNSMYKAEVQSAATQDKACLGDEESQEVKEVETTASCLVCYDECGGNNDAATMVVVDECAHAFCRDCLQQHCQHAIFNRQLPIPCPCKNDPSKACTVDLTAGLVETLLPSSSSNNHDDDGEEDVTAQRARRLYQRLDRLRNDPTLLTCPWCDALVEQQQQGDEERQSCETHPTSLSCKACRRTFCPIHGSAHPQETCAQYLKRRKTALEKQTERALDRYTRACSHCGGRIQKGSGCDHVVCTACGNDMCYRCGTHQHLTGKVIRSCSKCKMSYMDHRHECAFRFRLIIFLPLIVPCFVAYVILMGVLAIVTGGFGCCFGGGRWLATPRYMEVEQERWERAVAMGLSIVAMPFIGLMRDLGIRSCRLPHEIYLGIRAGAEEETHLPEIPTLHVMEDIESPTNSGSESSSQVSKG